MEESLLQKKERTLLVYLSSWVRGARDLGGLTSWSWDLGGVAYSGREFGGVTRLGGWQFGGEGEFKFGE